MSGRSRPDGRRRRLPRRWWVPVVAGAAALAAALTAFVAASLSAPRPWLPAPDPNDAPLVATFDYTTGRGLDVYVPAGPRRTGLPVVAMLHGCCGDRSDLASLAEGTAARGAVVFNADWTGIRPRAFPTAYRQAACVVRVARALAARFGGDPGRIALLGWSDGAMIATVVAEDGDRWPGPCLVSSGSSLPSVLVGVAGFFGWPVDRHGRLVTGAVSARAAAFFGGTPSTAAAAWRRGDPYLAVGDNDRLRIILLVGATDPLVVDNRRFAARLRRGGRQVEFRAAPYAGDQSMISPRTGEGLTVIRETLAALAVRP